MLYSKSDIIETLELLASSDLVGIPGKMVVHPKETVKNSGCEAVRVQVFNKRSGRENPKGSCRENAKTILPFIVSLEGNIGAGKSTIIQKLRQLYEGDEETSMKYFGKLAKAKIMFMQEPVDVWTSICDPETGESMLEKFYKDPKKYSFAFQVMVYNTHLHAFRQVVKENPDCVLLICERSIDAGRYIFAEMLRDDGMIDNISYQVYANLFDSNVGDFQLDAVLYLDVEPDVCLERIGTRARDGESSISLEYLEKCDRYYKKWLV